MPNKIKKQVQLDTLAREIDYLKTHGAGYDDTAIKQQIQRVNVKCNSNADDIADFKAIIPDTASTSNKLATIADIGSGGDTSNFATKTELQAVDNKATQNVTDIATINSVIPDTASTSNKLATVADLPSIDTSTLATKTELQAVDNKATQNTTDIAIINDVIPDTASTSNKLATVADLPSIDTSTLATKTELQAVDTKATQNATDIATINGIIPTNASSSNKLATVADIGSGSSGHTYDFNNNLQVVDTGVVYLLSNYRVTEHYFTVQLTDTIVFTKGTLTSNIVDTVIDSINSQLSKVSFLSNINSYGTLSILQGRSIVDVAFGLLKNTDNTISTVNYVVNQIQFSYQAVYTSLRCIVKFYTMETIQ